MKVTHEKKEYQERTLPFFKEIRIQPSSTIEQPIDKNILKEVNQIIYSIVEWSLSIFILASQFLFESLESIFHESTRGTNQYLQYQRGDQH